MMERLDFASVMAVLRRNIDEEQCPNQIELIDILFGDAIYEPDICIDIDGGLVCRWLNGTAKLSPRISNYYLCMQGRMNLANTIETDILPMMPDVAMTIQELKDLVVQAPNISSVKKQELLENVSSDESDTEESARFIAELLCFVMQLRFEKRDIRVKMLLTPGTCSPVVRDLIFDSEMPKPCRWFVGREDECSGLHQLLMENSKIFLSGIPGIGKSELVKMYAKRHGKEYTNLLYINYAGNLQQCIAAMDFSDDLPGESEQSRFQRHDRFLRSLKEDTLLIVDNFNTGEQPDEYLDRLLQYRCRIIFTTRNRYEEQCVMEVRELPEDTLLTLMNRFYDTRKKTDLFKDIIVLLHRHTYAVELAARLLAKGALRPKALLKKLQKEKASMDAEDKINSTKDGKSKRATYYDHIHALFSLYRLSKSKQELLRFLIFVPPGGMQALRLGSWLKLKNFNTLNDLIEMGFAQSDDRRCVSLHSMICEVAIDELKPTVKNCSRLLAGLQEISLLHGLEMPGYKDLFQITERIIDLIKKDDVPVYLLFLENVFQYMEKYCYQQGMQAVITELQRILSEGKGTRIDRAHLLQCEAICEKDPEKELRLTAQALETLGEIDESCAHFAANLHTNLGALYRKQRSYELAKLHMEQGIGLMEMYGLTGNHDSVIQIINYAVLLIGLGQLEKAYRILTKLSSKLEAAKMELSLDHGMVLEVLGSICVMQGDTQQAIDHLQAAIEIFEICYEDEPQLMEQKRQEVRRIASYDKRSINVLVT